jgi:hypothetical protein
VRGGERPRLAPLDPGGPLGVRTVLRPGSSRRLRRHTLGYMLAGRSGRDRAQAARVAQGCGSSRRRTRTCGLAIVRSQLPDGAGHRGTFHLTSAHASDEYALV